MAAGHSLDLGDAERVAVDAYRRFEVYFWDALGDFVDGHSHRLGDAVCGQCTGVLVTTVCFVGQFADEIDRRVLGDVEEFGTLDVGVAFGVVGGEAGGVDGGPGCGFTDRVSDVDLAFEQSERAVDGARPNRCRVVKATVLRFGSMR